MTDILIILIIIFFYCFMGLMWWKIFKKTGFHSALGILMLVPIVNLVMLAILALKEWPIQEQLSRSGASSIIPKKSLSVPLVVAIIIAAVVPILLLITAIAIPNFARARLLANEAVAQSLVKNISGAIENYASLNKGNYPVSEYDLKYPPGSAVSYNNKTINGYNYSLNLHSDSYGIVASPEKCGISGTKVFIVETGGKITEKDCR